MFLDPTWRILTIGDGDLSFSLALSRKGHPGHIEASTYDSAEVLISKYADNELSTLRERGIRVHTGIDITDSASVSQIRNQFDLIIFQFPLIESAHASGFPELDSNLLNRRLLRYFLLHSLETLLCKNGPQLCYITSKDVFPYKDWNIEQSINDGVDLPYLGSMKFETGDFPGYRIRNVKRDSLVLDTQAITYAWGKSPPAELVERLSPVPHSGSDYCSICRAGPFVGREDREKHFTSRGHGKKQAREEQWRAMVSEL
ncbi:MAG: class I SAM-dependent methyltransferase [Verrucomicrobiota bacterium]